MWRSRWPSASSLLITAPYLYRRPAIPTLRGAAVYAASRDSYSLSAPVRLLQAPIVDLESGTLSMPPSRTGLARSGEVLAMLITGKSARMTLDNATFTTDFSASEATFAEERRRAGSRRWSPHSRRCSSTRLGVRDSAIRIKTADGGVLLLENVTADVTAKPNGPFRAVGSFVFRGEKVNFDTTLRPGTDAQGGVRAINASITSELLNAKLDGTIMPGESLRVLSPLAEVTIPDLRRTARWLGTDWRAGSGFGNFAVKGQLEWVNRAIAFQKASVQLDDNTRNRHAVGELCRRAPGDRRHARPQDARPDQIHGRTSRRRSPQPTRPRPRACSPACARSTGSSFR